MSIEARNLAIKINNLDTSLEKLPQDSKEFQDGKIAYDNICRSIQFILPTGLEVVPNYLTDQGKLTYQKFFKSKIEAEINKNKKK